MALKFADLCHLGLLSDDEVKGLAATLANVTGEFNTAAEVVNLTKDEWNAAIAAIKLGDKPDPPSIAQKARYRNLLKLAVEKATEKEVKVIARKWKLSSVLNQTCDAEVVRLDAETISNFAPYVRAQTRWCTSFRPRPVSGPVECLSSSSWGWVSSISRFCCVWPTW
eukprot:3690566-Amphidinium_carterae.8